MQYSREESIFGHVHRHPAKIWMRHHADSAGKIIKIEARMVFDGGAYTSTSPAVLINGVTHTQGPYHCENAVADGYAVRTNNPPCGAMRGFGVVQACFAHESQMDKIAKAANISDVFGRSCRFRPKRGPHRTFTAWEVAQTWDSNSGEVSSESLGSTLAGKHGRATPIRGHQLTCRCAAG